MPLLVYDWDQSLGDAVFATARSLRAAMTEELSEFGITHAQWMVLALVAKREGWAQTDLADRVGVEPSTLCRTLDAMERDGWIRREPCPEDRRRKLIYAGKRAPAVWAQLSSTAHEVRARALEGIADEDAAKLYELLSRVRRNLRVSAETGVES